MIARLEKVIYNMLSGSPELAVKVGGKIYVQVAPEKDESGKEILNPVIVFGAEIRSTHYKLGRIDQAEMIVRVDSNTNYEASEIAAIVVELLDGQSGTDEETGLTIKNIRHLQTFGGISTYGYYKVSKFEIK